MPKEEMSSFKSHVFLFVSIAIPLSVFFLHDLLSFVSLFYDLLSFGSLFVRLLVMLLPYFLILVTGIYFLSRIILAVRTKNRAYVSLSVFLGAIIITATIAFFSHILIAKEIIFYYLHRDGFTEMTLVGQSSDCYLSGSSCIEYVDLPQQLAYDIKLPSLFVLSSSSNKHVLGTLSRDNIYYIFYKDLESTPARQKIYQSYVDCFYNLGNGWFICSLFM